MSAFPMRGARRWGRGRLSEAAGRRGPVVAGSPEWLTPSRGSPHAANSKERLMRPSDSEMAGALESAARAASSAAELLDGLATETCEGQARSLRGVAREQRTVAATLAELARLLRGGEHVVVH